MFSVKRIVAPTAQPVPLDLAKQQCRVTDDSNADLLVLYIQAATDHAEKITGRAIMPQTLRLSRSYFPGFPPAIGASRNLYALTHYWDVCRYSLQPILLPRPPLVEVLQITYLDPTGTRQTLAPDTYQVSQDAEPGAISPTYGNYWPAIAWERPDALQIDYTAGYDEVPSAIQLGILGLVAHWYENRESVVLTSSPNASTIVPQFVDELLLSEAAPTVFDWEA